MYENTESRTKSMLTTSTSSESIFSNELDDTNSEHKFEDKIVRHLTGDVESIAIPKNNHHVAYASSSIESTTSIKSSSKWYSDTDERPWSPDPYVVVSSSSSSLEVPPLTMSPSGSYHVAMPK